MNLIARVRFHWRHYGLTERGFVLLPFLILTPRLINHLNGGHNGEASQELVITVAVLGLLLLLAVEIRRQTLQYAAWQGRNRWLLLAVSSFACWSAASIFWTLDVGATMDHTILWLNYTAVIFLGRAVLRRRSVLGLLVTLVTAGTGVACFRLAQYILTDIDRPLSSALYMNLGVDPELLVTILPLLCLIHLMVRRRTLAVLALVMIALVWMGGLSTYQRTPILASVLALGLLSGGLLMKWIVPYNKWRVAFLFVTLLVTGSLQMSLPSKSQGWNPVPNETGKDYVVKQVKGIRNMEVDTSSRLQFWATALEMARANPLWGVGAGAYKSGYVTYRRVANSHPYWGQLKDFSQLEGVDCVFRAHNEYMQVLGELGGTGLFLLVAVILSIGALCWNVPRRQRGLAIVIAASASAFLLSSSLTSYSFRWIPCGLTFFLVVSLLLPISQQGFVKAEQSLFLIHQERWALGALMLLMCLGGGRITQVMLSEYYQLAAQEEKDANPESAQNLYQRALAIDPYNFSAAAELGGLLYRHHQPAAALGYLEQGIQHGINNTFNHALLSFAYAQCNQPTRAHEVLQQAAEAYPGSIFTRILYADALMRDGRVDAARTQRETVRAINADEAEVWELIMQRGVGEAAQVAIQRNLPHPIRIQPKVGLGVLQERERMFTQK